MLSIVEQKLQEQALKERMLLESFFILSTVEFIEERLERKLLELDRAIIYNKNELLLKRQILEFIRKLKREEVRMDEFMAKYSQIYEKKKLLSSPIKKGTVYLRGVPPHKHRAAQSAGISSEIKKTK